jgi:metallo-beta-lactamase class B
MRFQKQIVALACALAAPIAAFAQTTIPAAPTFPNEQKDLSNAWINSARVIAGGDQTPAYLRRCILAQSYPSYGDYAQANYAMPPIQVFDNLYWIGGGSVSSWALKTSAGIVLIDSMNNASEGEYIVAAGIRKLGFSMSDVKYLFITHEHGDHYGGARYLQDTYGLRLLASDTAWTAMDNGTASRPRRDITVSDGQDWTLGDTTIHFVATPGHTPGALSTILTVYDHGTKRMAGFYGGFGIPSSAADKMSQVDSLAKFGAITSAYGVDTLLANHQTQDLSLYNQEMLRQRRSAVPNPQSAADFIDPHPYVVGSDQWQRFLTVQSQCVRVSAARSAQTLPH